VSGRDGSRRRRRLLPRLAIAVATLLIADQVAQHLLLAGGTFFGRPVVPYDPPLFSPEQRRFVEHLREVARGARLETKLLHDPELGWVATGESRGEPFDCFGGRVGRREVSLERSEGRRRIALFGCSFTFGEEVGPRESWAAAMEVLRPDLEVCNLAVSGWGSDQALLRYRRDGPAVAADEVWLGFVPSTLGRLESLYRPAHRHWSALAWFKPRFELGGDGELALVPNPGHSIERTIELLSDQRAFLAAVGEHDRWVRRSPVAFAARGSRLAHHSGIARLLLTIVEVRGRQPEETLLGAEDDPALPLFSAIVQTMAREVRGTGARFRLVVLPSRADLVWWRQRGMPPSAGETLRALADSGIEVVDVTEALWAAGVVEQAGCWMPNGHYAPEVNRIVAEVLVRSL
jgi:hypothetical protein